MYVHANHPSYRGTKLNLSQVLSFSKTSAVMAMQNAAGACVWQGRMQLSSGCEEIGAISELPLWFITGSRWWHWFGKRSHWINYSISRSSRWGCFSVVILVDADQTGDMHTANTHKWGWETSGNGTIVKVQFRNRLMPHIKILYGNKRSKPLHVILKFLKILKT